MSQNENVTAQLANNTQYTLTYQSSNQEWGNFYLKNQTIDPNSSVAIFYAVGAEGSGTGCEGSVIYAFTDQFGNQQTITLTYSDPYIGSNSFGVSSTPNGITGSATDPSGGSVNVTYTIGGAVTQEVGVPASNGPSQAKLSVTASLDNNTQYTVTYQSANVEWGTYSNNTTTIGPHSTAVIFYAAGTLGAARGCAGTVTYAFTDQDCDQQTITLTYSDPFIGSNSFSVSSAPNGITGSATDPSGGSVSVTYTIDGAVTEEVGVPASSSLSHQST